MVDFFTLYNLEIRLNNDIIHQVSALAAGSTITINHIISDTKIFNNLVFSAYAASFNGGEKTIILNPIPVISSCNCPIPQPSMLLEKNCNVIKLVPTSCGLTVDIHYSWTLRNTGNVQLRNISIIDYPAENGFFVGLLDVGGLTSGSGHYLPTWKY